MPKIEKLTLKIFIKGVYFDQIADKKKIVEYRKFTPFWSSRLLDKIGKKRHYDQIEFINGYRPDSRRVITVYEGFTKKGAEYLIRIGKIIRKNY